MSTVFIPMNLCLVFDGAWLLENWFWCEFFDATKMAMGESVLEVHYTCVFFCFDTTASVWNAISAS